MEGGSSSKGKNNIPSVEDVFLDIKHRRNALRICGFHFYADAFYRLCDPKKYGVCLVGFGDEKWTVKPKLESEELLVAADLRPEPSFGINFIRDSMQRDQWLRLVADLSDSWLLSLASFTASQNQFSARERRRLCIMVSELSTLSDEIRSWKAKREREQQIPTASSSQKSPLIPRKPRTLKVRRGRKIKDDDEAKSYTSISSEGYQGKASSEESRAMKLGEAKKEEGNNYEEKVCRACKHKEEKWIRCCNCDSWFHEKCANNVVSSSSSSSAAAAASENNFRCAICRTPPKLRKYLSL